MLDFFEEVFSGIESSILERAMNIASMVDAIFIVVSIFLIGRTVFV